MGDSFTERGDLSEWHGTGLKVSRLHFADVDLVAAFEKRDWLKAFWQVYVFYVEVEPYLNNDLKHEGELVIRKDWVGLTGRFVRKGNGVRDDAFFAALMDFHVKCKKVVARLGLDVKFEKGRTYLTRTV